MATTPKQKMPNCFLCESKPRTYKVLRYKDGVIVDKIASITGEDRSTVLNYATVKTAAMCRVCLERLNRAYDFAVTLKEKITGKKFTTAAEGNAADDTADGDAHNAADDAADGDAHNAVDAAALNLPIDMTIVKLEIDSGNFVKSEFNAEELVKSDLDLYSDTWNTEAKSEQRNEFGSSAENTADSGKSKSLSQKETLDSKEQSLEVGIQSNKHNSMGSMESQTRIKDLEKDMDSKFQERKTDSGSNTQNSSLNMGIIVSDVRSLHKDDDSPDQSQPNTVIDSQNQSLKTDESCKSETTVEFLTRNMYTDVRKTAETEEIADIVSTNEVMMKAVERKILRAMNDTCGDLAHASKTTTLTSVLWKRRRFENLLQNGDQLLDAIIHEMADRLPFLLDMLTMIVTGGKVPTESNVAPIVAAYAILMYGRSEMLSAWHRLTALIMLKGHLSERAMQKLNQLGVTMSPTIKHCLLEEASEWAKPANPRKGKEPKGKKDVATFIASMGTLKIAPKKSYTKRRSSLPKRTKKKADFPLTQNSPPPKELFTATKQSHLSQFFNSSNEDTTDESIQSKGDNSHEHGQSGTEELCPLDLEKSLDAPASQKRLSSPNKVKQTKKKRRLNSPDAKPAPEHYNDDLTMTNKKVILCRLVNTENKYTVEYDQMEAGSVSKSSGACSSAKDSSEEHGSVTESSLVRNSVADSCKLNLSLTDLHSQEKPKKLSHTNIKGVYVYQYVRDSGEIETEVTGPATNNRAVDVSLRDGIVAESQVRMSDTPSFQITSDDTCSDKVPCTDSVEPKLAFSVASGCDLDDSSTDTEASLQLDSEFTLRSQRERHDRDEEIMALQMLECDSIGGIEDENECL